jgi:hypothetical protein
MSPSFTIQFGKKRIVVDSPYLPPVGATIKVDRHFSEEGNSFEVEITAHEWELRQSFKENQNDVLDVTIKTQPIGDAR